MEEKDMVANAMYFTIDGGVFKQSIVSSPMLYTRAREHCGAKKARCGFFCHLR
jgi:hypothetical protein